jgi:arylsulfatase A-like enzyme
MTAELETAKPALDKPSFFLRLALGIGVATGLGEVLLFWAQKHLLHRFIFVGRDIVWMAPLAEGMLFLGIGLVLLLLARIWSRFNWVAAIGTLGVLAFLALLLMYTPLHKGAAVLMALGLGIQLARIVRKHPEGVNRLVRVGTPALIVMALLLAAASRGFQAWQERRAVARIGEARTGSPNVLFIILDTVRALSLSAYGYQRPTSPELEKFARSAMRFDYALSNAPWTLPSHASFFTGRLPNELSADWLTPLDGRAPTLAEALAAHGYLTSGFVANTLYCDTEKGLNRGFQHWEDYEVTPSEIARSSVLIRELTVRRFARQPFGSYELVGRKRAEDVNAQFLSWLDGVQGRPFFTFLNYFEAHAPYLPDEKYRKQFTTAGLTHAYNGWTRYRGKPRGDTLIADWVQDNRDRYDASIAQLDAQLGKLFTELERRGILQNTIVIVAADHGEQFGEHAVMGHGNSLYLPVLHVPLMIRFPGQVPQGAVTRPVSLRDIPATVADLSGLGGDVSFPGRSLARYWRGDSTLTSAPDTLLMTVEYNPRLPKGTPLDHGSMRAVVLDSLHYIMNGDQREELYVLKTDPSERSDLAPRREFQPDVARHREALRALVRFPLATP